MTDADVILPVCASNSQCHIMAMMAMRTLRASTDATIYVMANNTPDLTRRLALQQECELLGMHFYYDHGPFNIARAFNIGATFGCGKYIAYATSDVIYFPDWLDNIISLWEENPQYFALCNYSFDVCNNPCVRQSVIPERRIVDTHNPSAGVIVLKRESGYKWDEQFPLWEIDTDFLYYIEAHNLKCGYCLNARCDHLVDGVKAHVDYQTNFRMTGDEFYGRSKARVKSKWGERYKG
jgi:hypothetical protein